MKFKEKVNRIPSDELRCLPIGRDFMGKAYWFQMVIPAAVLFTNFYSVCGESYVCVMS